MKLLRRNSLTVESLVWPYLPLSWDKSKFTDNSWASMRIIVEPAGLFNIGCIPSGTTTGVRSYALNSTQSSKGAVFGTGSDGGENGVLDGQPDNKLSPGAYWHGGDLYDSTTGRELHTCAMTFDDGTEATLLINSAIGAAVSCVEAPHSTGATASRDRIRSRMASEMRTT